MVGGCPLKKGPNRARIDMSTLIRWWLGFTDHIPSVEATQPTLQGNGTPFEVHPWPRSPGSNLGSISEKCRFCHHPDVPTHVIDPRGLVPVGGPKTSVNTDLKPVSGYLGEHHREGLCITSARFCAKKAKDAQQSYLTHTQDVVIKGHNNCKR